MFGKYRELECYFSDQRTSRVGVHALKFPRIAKAAGHRVTLPCEHRPPGPTRKRWSVAALTSAAALQSFSGLQQHRVTWPSPPVRNSPGSPGRCLEPAAVSVTATLRGSTLPRLPAG